MKDIRTILNWRIPGKDIKIGAFWDPAYKFPLLKEDFRNSIQNFKLSAKLTLILGHNQQPLNWFNLKFDSTSYVFSSSLT